MKYEINTFTQRLNKEFVGLGAATGPGLLYAQCSQAVNCCRREWSPFPSLHVHALSHFLFTNCVTAVSKCSETACWPWGTLIFLFCCVCFLITADLSHYIGVWFIDQIQKMKWEHMWSFGEKTNCPLQQQPAAETHKEGCEPVPRAMGDIILFLFVEGFLVVWNLNKATCLLHKVFCLQRDIITL